MKTGKYLVIAVICIVFLLPRYSLAQKHWIKVSGKLGGFNFTAFDEEDEWASSGFLMGGRVSFPSFYEELIMSLDIEDVKTEKSTYTDIGWELEQVETRAHNLSMFLLGKRKFSEGTIAPYIGGGFGLCHTSGTVTISFISKDVSDTDFAYKVFIGLDMFDYVFLEVGYTSGGRNGNTGIAFLGGFGWDIAYE